jgi:hypothetical protein
VDVHLPPSGRDLSVGTRVCLLVAGLLVIVAGYLLVTPLERVGSEGPPFDCGTALAPAGGDFARGVCGDLNQRRLLQGGTVLLLAIGLAGGGRLAFGPPRRRRRPDWEPPEPRSGPPAGPEWARPSGRPALSPAAVPPSRRAPDDEYPATSRDAGPPDAERS